MMLSAEGLSSSLRLAHELQDIGWMSVTAWRSPHLDPPQWQPLLPITPLGPAQRHLFLLPSASQPVTHLKLTMHPDGGLGRFRAYGRVIPPPAPAHPTGEAVDLAYVLNGGTVTGESDQHFGRGGNLILPGRGKDMGDGWETRRSRGRLGTGKGDWVVVKLCVFSRRRNSKKGDWIRLILAFASQCRAGLPRVGRHRHPALCRQLPQRGRALRDQFLGGTYAPSHYLEEYRRELTRPFHHISQECPKSDDPNWTRILEMTKLGPHRQHFYQLSQPEKAWTHVRLDIHPGALLVSPNSLPSELSLTR